MTTLERAQDIIRDFNLMTDYSYGGDLSLGERWGFTFTQTRDSDALERSNYTTIRDDMSERFPDDIVDEHWGHWACGWVDQLAVRMLNDDGKVTLAGNSILEWMDKIEDYPIADEDHFSQLESEESWECFENDLPPECNLIPNLPDDWKQQVYEFIDVSYYESGNHYSTSIEDALKSLGFYSLEELEPFAYYDLGDDAFYRYVVEYDDGRCVWLTANCFLGNGFVYEQTDDDGLPSNPIEIDTLPNNVLESLDCFTGALLSIQGK
jgi:hypothetical protein